jgi:pyruvate dehydrogenase E2 component (dihydrolipoamide acetyltransferase)
MRCAIAEVLRARPAAGAAAVPAARAVHRALSGVRRMFDRLPLRLIPAVLELTAFASYTLNLDLGWAGVPRDAFGSVMITHIGSLGLEEAYVALVPYSRVPVLLALGAIRDTPVARDGRVAVERTMKLCATFDHRVLDGAHAAAMADLLRAWIEDPIAHFDPIPSVAPRAISAGASQR